jgi:hypothetical protein
MEYIFSEQELADLQNPDIGFVYLGSQMTDANRYIAAPVPPPRPDYLGLKRTEYLATRDDKPTEYYGRCCNPYCRKPLRANEANPPVDCAARNFNQAHAYCNDCWFAEDGFVNNHNVNQIIQGHSTWRTTNCPGCIDKLPLNNWRPNPVNPYNLGFQKGSFCFRPPPPSLTQNELVVDENGVVHVE